ILDPGLQMDDTRLTQLSEMFLLQVDLYFVIEVVAGIALDQFGDHCVKIFHVHDVVGDMKYFSVLSAKLFDLVQGTLRRFTPITHGGAIQPTERAMLLGAPPATT